MKQHKTIAEFLRCAKSLVKRGWIQGDYARTAGGRWSPVHEPQAAKFCMMGALRRCGDGTRLYYKAVDKLSSVCPMGNIPEFNDYQGRKKSHVLAKFDEAIRKCRRG